jgi:hypothetical protein
MSLLRIVHQPNVTQVFIASEAISDLATIEISTVGLNYVQGARDTNPERAAGVARGSATSGRLVRAVVQGIVSGVTCANAVNAGDRLMIASGGKVTPLNFGVISGIVGATVSGLTASGHLILSGFGGGIISGYTQVNLSGGYNTAKVIGKALVSAAAGSGLSMLVMGG